VTCTNTGAGIMNFKCLGIKEFNTYEGSLWTQLYIRYNRRFRKRTQQIFVFMHLFEIEKFCAFRFTKRVWESTPDLCPLNVGFGWSSCLTHC
jgi:hypothetical protein